MRISDWSSDVCSSDLRWGRPPGSGGPCLAAPARPRHSPTSLACAALGARQHRAKVFQTRRAHLGVLGQLVPATQCHGLLCVGAGEEGLRLLGGEGAALHCEAAHRFFRQPREVRSEEHTSELQSLMRTSYAAFCLKKKKK